MTLAGLKINPITNSISSSDGGKVILQINGANATPEEVQTLQPHQVKRIEYSDYTGIRFEGASKVINYIIERKDKGGVIGVDLMNSLNTLAGDDVSLYIRPESNSSGKRIFDSGRAGKSFG
jgi:hypothetical protein